MPKGIYKRRKHTQQEKLERRAQRRAMREARALQCTNPAMVLTLDQWAILAGFSVSSARRIAGTADGPPLLRISARRYGVRYSDHLAWAESRCGLKIASARN
jgi:hypothetical protein